MEKNLPQGRRCSTPSHSPSWRAKLVRWRIWALSWSFSGRGTWMRLCSFTGRSLLCLKAIFSSLDILYFWTILYVFFYCSVAPDFRIIQSFSISYILKLIVLYWAVVPLCRTSTTIFNIIFVKNVVHTAPPPSMSLEPCPVFISFWYSYFTFRLCSLWWDSCRAPVRLCPSWWSCRWLDCHCLHLLEHLVWSVPALQGWRCATVWYHWQGPHHVACMLALKVWAMCHQKIDMGPFPQKHLKTPRDSLRFLKIPKDPKDS